MKKAIALIAAGTWLPFWIALDVLPDDWINGYWWGFPMLFTIFTCARCSLLRGLHLILDEYEKDDE